MLDTLGSSYYGLTGAPVASDVDEILALIGIGVIFLIVWDWLTK